jgi:para-aminobenzoate synthetase
MGMRTLLIDNYDSFTFNLFQLVATVVGEPPLVVRNDDWQTWKSFTPGSFDAIIISPGPGTPTCAEDFGISSPALQLEVPLLGVCLGHQGMCASEGAEVVRAPEPMHGRTSPVFHSGQGIFRGLPSPFSAVRYHSLLVDDVPAVLTVTATTSSSAGGIVMAVEHAIKPQWGVQFHPESILTEHGAHLLGNFFMLARDRRSLAVQPPKNEPPSPMPASAANGSRLAAQMRAQPAEDTELLIRRVPTGASAQMLFELLFADQQPSFWLDSSAELSADSRFSIVGGMGPLGEWVTAEAGKGAVSVTTPDRSVTEVSVDMFDYLSAQLAARQLPPTGLPFEFSLGYVGYLGYEMKADCGGEKSHATDLADAAFLFCDRAVVLDHETNEAWILSLSTDAAREQALAWLDEAERAVRLPARPSMPCGQPAPRVPAPVNVAPRHSRERYAELVEECLEEIRAGESYEICLTNTFTVSAAVDPLETFRILRRTSPVPYGAYLSFPSAAVLSASPESFLRVGPDGRVRTKPIKGTRPRGRTPEEDAALADELATAEKDRAENLMIVDLLRNDLGMVADVGSVKVTRFFDVESFATVHQLVSTVEARLSPGFTAVDCVRAAFPGGSMTGAPKHRTMQIIDQLEGGSRGIYSGALGYFSLTGAADLSIVIRTLIVYPDHITVGAGGAIVALSDPGAEVEEMLVKARAPIAAALAAATGTAAADSSGVLVDSPEGPVTRP